MSVSLPPCPASPKSVFFAPEVCSSPLPSPPTSPSPYKIAYDVSLSPSVNPSVKKEETKFELLDVLQSLSAVNCQFTDIAEKMLASSHDETLLCLPMIGQILESCAVLVAVHQHRDEIKADIAKDSSDNSSQASSDSTSQANNFIGSITTFIDSAAPAGVFSRRKAKRRHAKMLRSRVHPELFTMWYYSTQLFTAKSTSVPSPKPKSLPTVNLKDVNVFAMRNVPTPTQFSVHGCSPDHAFYKSSFRKCAPFGSIYGYKTSVGVVPVPDDPVYGHVWNHDEGGWMIQALFQEEDFNKPWRISRESSRKAKGRTRYSTVQQHFR